MLIKAIGGGNEEKRLLIFNSPLHKI